MSRERLEQKCERTVSRERECQGRDSVKGASRAAVGENSVE